MNLLKRKRVHNFIKGRRRSIMGIEKIDLKVVMKLPVVAGERDVLRFKQSFCKIFFYRWNSGAGQACGDDCRIRYFDASFNTWAKSQNPSSGII